MSDIRYATLGAFNGIALALDLDDPSECPELENGGEQVRQLVLNGCYVEGRKKGCALTSEDSVIG